MLLKVKTVGVGLHPSELVVEVQTRSGIERLVVDRRSIEANSLNIGTPLKVEDGQYLIELPRESMTGEWRVWVGKSALKHERAA